MATPILKVTKSQYITFYGKNVLTNICFQKQNVRQNRIRPFYALLHAYVSVLYAKVECLVFDVIDRLNATQHQKSKYFNVMRKHSIHCIVFETRTEHITPVLTV